MAAPKHHGCYGTCEKEVFDANNAQIVGKVTHVSTCPDLTAAQIAKIQKDIEDQFKGEIVTQKCLDSDCSCKYGPQPGWPPLPYPDKIDLDWKAEVKINPRQTCEYTFKATVDTAHVTVKGDCKRKPDAPPKKGVTKLD